jgi:hypothetical protein
MAQKMQLKIQLDEKEAHKIQLQIHLKRLQIQLVDKEAQNIRLQIQLAEKEIQFEHLENADNSSDDSSLNDLSEPPPVTTSVTTEVESTTPTLSPIQNKDKFQILKTRAFDALVCETLLEKRRNFGIWDIVGTTRMRAQKTIIQNNHFGNGPIRFIENEEDNMVAYHGVHPNASQKEHDRVMDGRWLIGRFVQTTNPHSSYENIYETHLDTFDTSFCTNCEITPPKTEHGKTICQCKGHTLNL